MAEHFGHYIIRRMSWKKRKLKEIKRELPATLWAKKEKGTGRDIIPKNIWYREFRKTNSETELWKEVEEQWDLQIG